MGLHRSARSPAEQISRINLVELVCLRNRFNLKIRRIPGDNSSFSQSLTSQNSFQCPDGSVVVLDAREKGKRKG
jgi:hypothetical protein